MTAKHKLALQLQFRLQEMLTQGGDPAEIKAIQEEIAYVLRISGTPRKTEIERVRTRFNLTGKSTDLPKEIVPMNHGAAPPPQPKRDQERLLYLRFCVHCDAELAPWDRRWRCVNPMCSLNLISGGRL
jgi:hypothetical protein